MAAAGALTMWKRFGFTPDRESSARVSLRDQRYVVVDTEFTSLQKDTNRLLSVGAIAMQGTTIHLGDQFYRVVNPRVPIPAETVVVHRLLPADVQHAEPPEAALLAFKKFAEGAVLVGHFVSLDLHILQKELGGEGKELTNPAIDLATIQRWILLHERYSEDLDRRLENMDLGSLAKEYRVPVRDLHHALGDAYVTAQLWQKMIVRVERLGVQTIRDLLRIGKARK
jgi:DNA polymerase-3 subunit epsilon